MSHLLYSHHTLVTLCVTHTQQPTWSNHHSIWKDAGVPQQPYRYYKPETRGLDFEGLMEDVQVCFLGFKA